MAGKFIVLEGIDGCGKSTQAKLLEEYLVNKGIETYLTSEPTRGVIGSIIRAFLKDITLGNQVNEEEFGRLMSHLFSADRIIHSSEIKRKLDDDVWVICDRYKFSTFAYNYLPNGKNSLFSESFNFLNGFLEPDLIIMVDVDIEEAIKRIESRNLNKEIFENKEFLSGVCNHYKILEAFYKFYHVDGMQEINKVQEDIRRCVDSKFGI